MGLTLDDLSTEWALGLCRELARRGPEARPDVRVHAVEVTELGSAQGVLSRYERSTREAIVGHRVIAIRWELDGRERSDRLVLKAKVPGAMVRRRLEDVYRRFDPQLAELQHRLAPSILDDTHTRELAICELPLPALRAISPGVARVWRDPDAEVFAVVMELLEGVRHERTLHDLDVWQPADIDCALTQLARVHGELLGTISATAPPPWLVPFAQLHNAALLDYQAALLAYNARTFPELFDRRRARRLESALASAPARHARIAARPLTLVHGDFTPRNMCLKGDADAARLCAYDWELAQVHLPQRDVCELLCYVLRPEEGWASPLAARLLERYGDALGAAAGRQLDRDELRADLGLALIELCTFKLLVQGITHQLLGQRGYFERMVQNAFSGLDELVGAGE